MENSFVAMKVEHFSHVCSLVCWLDVAMRMFVNFCLTLYVLVWHRRMCLMGMKAADRSIACLRQMIA